MTVRPPAANRAADFSTTFGDNPGHVVAPHELRHAWLTAKTLAEQLELAEQPVLQRIALYVREQVFLELMAAEGFVEVVPDPA